MIYLYYYYSKDLYLQRVAQTKAPCGVTKVNIFNVPLGIKKRGFFHWAYALNQFKWTDKGEPCGFYSNHGKPSTCNISTIFNREQTAKIPLHRRISDMSSPVYRVQTDQVRAQKPQKNPDYRFVIRYDHKTPLEKPGTFHPDRLSTPAWAILCSISLILLGFSTPANRVRVKHCMRLSPHCLEIYTIQCTPCK